MINNKIKLNSLFNCLYYLTLSSFSYYSKRCVLACQHPNILSSAQKGIILSRDMHVSQACYWTIIAGNLTNDQRIFPPYDMLSNEGDSQLMLRVKLLKTSCFDSFLQIYDGVPPNPRTVDAISQSPFSLLATLCGPDVVHEERRLFRSTTGIFTIVYEGNIIKNMDEKVFKDLDQGFEAEYTTLRCPDSCPSPFVCGSGVNGSQCICAENRTGDVCQYEKCPNGCYSQLAHGDCNQVYNFIWWFFFLMTGSSNSWKASIRVNS